MRCDKILELVGGWNRERLLPAKGVEIGKIYPMIEKICCRIGWDALLLHQQKNKFIHLKLYDYVKPEIT